MQRRPLTPWNEMMPLAFCRKGFSTSPVKAQTQDLGTLLAAWLPAQI